MRALPSPPAADMEIGQRANWGREPGNDMGAVDFEAFVHELADVSGQAIRPSSAPAARRRGQGRGAAFDPVTAADRAAEQACAR